MQQSLLPENEEGGDRRDNRFVLDYPEAELIFGLVYAVGTDYTPVLEYLKDYIRLCGYAADSLHISDWFPESADRLGLDIELLDSSEYGRVASRIDAGNKIRARTKQADIFALIGASKIFSSREMDDNDNPVAHKRRAHILVSVKRPEEVESLRKIYGTGFFLIGIFADESQRIEYLTSQGLRP